MPIPPAALSLSLLPPPPIYKRAIFDWIFPLWATPAAAIELKYRASADTGMDAGMLQARLAREAASLEGVKRNSAKLTTQAAVADFVFREHAAYAAYQPLLAAAHEKEDPVLVSTY